MKELARWIGLTVCFLRLGPGCSSGSADETASHDAGTQDASGFESSAQDAPAFETGTPDGHFEGDAGVAVDFCLRLYGAIADHMMQCACSATAVQKMRDFGNVKCADPSALWTQLDTAIASGSIVFHPERVEAVLAPLAGTTSCYAVWTDLGLDSVTVYTIGGVFTGTRELGSSCTLPVGYKGGVHDCKEGLFCAPDGAGAPRCVSLVGLGGACDLGNAPGRMCFERRPPDSDDEFESAFDRLICIPSAIGATTGMCEKDLEDGQPCHDDGACKSGRCVSNGAGTGVCSPKQADGSPCVSRTDCTSGACRVETSTTPSACAPPLANGEPCGYDDLNCASAECYTLDNQTSGTTPGVCGPKLDKPVGATCAQGYECATGVCRSSLCWEHICR